MTVTLNAKVFRSAQMAQSKNDARYYLCGVCVQTSGRIIGTNGHLLYACTPTERSPLGNENAFDQDRIINVQGKIPTGAEWLTFDQDRMICTTEKGKPFSFTFVDGTYPNVDLVIPTLPRESPPAPEICLDPKYLAIIGAMANSDVRMFLCSDRDPVLFTSELPGDGATETMVLMPKHL